MDGERESYVSRRSILRGAPAVAASIALPAAASVAASSADADMITLVARIMATVKESDAAYFDASDREENAAEDYPRRPSMLDAKYPYKRETDTIESLQTWFDGLQPDDVPYRSIAERLARMKAWEAERVVIDETYGVPDANRKADSLADLLMGELVPALSDMQPATSAGLGAKAQAVAALHESWGTLHEVVKVLTASILADAQRLAGGAHA